MCKKNYIYMLHLTTNIFRPYNNVTFKKVYITATNFDESHEKLLDYLYDHDLDPIAINFLYEEEIEE